MANHQIDRHGQITLVTSSTGAMLPRHPTEVTKSDQSYATTVGSLSPAELAATARLFLASAERRSKEFHDLIESRGSHPMEKLLLNILDLHVEVLRLSCELHARANPPTT